MTIADFPPVISQTLPYTITAIYTKILNLFDVREGGALKAIFEATWGTASYIEIEIRGLSEASREAGSIAAEPESIPVPDSTTANLIVWKPQIHRFLLADWASGKFRATFQLPVTDHIELWIRSDTADATLVRFEIPVGRGL